MQVWVLPPVVPAADSALLFFCDASANQLLYLQGELLGVLDLDSPETNRFTAQDQAMIEEVARVYLDSIRA